VSESIHEQIAAALATRLTALEADGGVTCWYTPDRVDRVTFFEDRFLDTAVEHQILLWPGAETHMEHSTGQCRAVCPLTILVAHQIGAASEMPDEIAPPTRWTIASRSARDVLRALWADVTLGGLADNVAEEGMVVEYARFVQGWACVEITVPISYTYPKETP
jgi:hypothetical protein